MSDRDEEFEKNIELINTGKSNFSEDEENIIDGWLSKLSEPRGTDIEKTVRNEYARALARLVNKEKQIWHPFKSMPPEGNLMPLSEISSKYKSFAYQVKKMPCQKSQKSVSTQGTGTKPKTKKADKSTLQFDSFVVNEFEDPEEMAKAVARSKGQTFADFVLSISRHTADFGQGLYSAMKAETSSFKDYVDRVLSQRIKDLTKVLDDEQNRELQKIKKDIEGWKSELSNVKKRIREIIPNFDLDSYRKDKNYLKKMFTIETNWSPDDDSFERWKEENCHRLKEFSDMICNVIHCNEQNLKKIANIKCETSEMEAREAIKHQNYINQINCEIAEYEKLKLERDKLHREHAKLLSQFREACH